MIEDIKELIEEFDLKSKSRKRETVYKRYYLMNVLFVRSKMSLAKIGEMFGRDHSTVIHAIKEHKRWFKTMDKEYLRAIHPLPDLVNETRELPEIYYFDCQTTEDSITITGKFTKQFLLNFNKKLTIEEISLIFATS